MANMLIAHGGGPTAVLNASLYGAVREAQRTGSVGHIYGAVFGTAGILKEQFAELGTLPETELQKLLYTPGSAIGTSRTPQAGQQGKVSWVSHQVRFSSGVMGAASFAVASLLAALALVTLGIKSWLEHRYAGDLAAGHRH